MHGWMYGCGLMDVECMRACMMDVPYRAYEAL
jgi:hypothetical protein